MSSKVGAVAFNESADEARNYFYLIEHFSLSYLYYNATFSLFQNI